MVTRWMVYTVSPNASRSQERWVENGAMYITTREQLEKSKLRYSGNIGILEMPIHRNFQIDTMDDLELVEMLELKSLKLNEARYICLWVLVLAVRPIDVFF